MTAIIGSATETLHEFLQTQHKIAGLDTPAPLDSKHQIQEVLFMAFSENLQYIRAQAGITQEQLAEQLDVSRQSVSKWESGVSHN